MTVPGGFHSYGADMKTQICVRIRVLGPYSDRYLSVDCSALLQCQVVIPLFRGPAVSVPHHDGGSRCWESFVEQCLDV